MEHAKNFPPSGAKAWMDCPAWESSDVTHPAAAEGTRLHGVAEDLFNGKSIDPDDLERIGDYVTYIMDLSLEASKWSVEDKLTMSVTGEFGTSDFSGVIDRWGIKWLHVVDLKTGASAVSAKNNAQLKLYALGALEKYKPAVTKTMVIMTIHQNGKVKSDCISAASLKEWEKDVQVSVQNRLQVLALEDPTIEGRPSFSACFWCAHKETCTAKNGDLEKELCELN